MLAPAIALADGYAIDAQTANAIERQKGEIKQWQYSPAVFLPHAGQAREAPDAGEICRQPDLAATLRKLVEAEQTALLSATYKGIEVFKPGPGADFTVPSSPNLGGWQAMTSCQLEPRARFSRRPTAHVIVIVTD